MLYYAVKILVGDRAKYFGIIIGLSFASFIIVQQASIFYGLIARTYGLISDMQQASIWVMDPYVEQINDPKALKDTELYRVKSVAGVEWAVPLYKGMITARMRNGNFQQCVLLGIDNATLIGAPPIVSEGAIRDIRRPEAIIVNDVGAETQLAIDGAPLQLGEVLELNDHRSVVVGKCTISRSFQTQPVIYTTYSRATQFTPPQRNMLSYILVSHTSDLSPEEVCRRIERQTGLRALTSKGFEEKTKQYYLRRTAIPINFGVAVLLGFIIGAVISGQTFYNFTLDNLRYLGTFKAMGVTDKTLIQMTLLQALIVGIVGWGIGVGAAAAFGFLTRNTELSFLLLWQVLLGSGAAMLFMCLSAAMISLTKVLRLDPAIVFKS